MTRTPDTSSSTRGRSGPHRELAPEEVAAFRARVRAEGEAHWRDLPWRHSRDPYAVLVSEVMLQQTQVPRVVPRWVRWLELFPTVDALAAAPLDAVLAEWQGLGYNRRAVALKRAAERVVECFGGAMPSDEAELRSLPGIGPATAAGVRAFAFGLPAVYLETNVRAVFLHELFADEDGVPDREVVPLIAQTLDASDPRSWYWALLDYGAWLKKTVPNPSRRSAHHTRQSPFEGSRRQKRAQLLRAVLALGEGSTAVLADAVGLEPDATSELLEALCADGLVVRVGADGWTVP